MIGKLISHYMIAEKIGSGGMGEVYLAEDIKLKRTVALKFLPMDLTRNSEAKERFIQEAQAASALDHPNICTIHEIDQTADGRIFIVMAHYRGETLEKKIKASPVRVDEAMDIAYQVARGLAKAHASGIVHRDVKPANIMVTRDGAVKILDFGLAKLRGVSRLTKESSTLGTVHYMSPEQALGKDVDQRTDIWSLGVVLYEMLTGQLPFNGDYEQAVIYSILNEEPAKLRSLRPEAPPELERIVERCLEKAPDRRYACADELIADLRSVQQHAVRTISLENKRPRRRRWISLAAGAGMLAALAAAALLLLPRHRLPAGERSVAVLPFVDMSPQKDQEYFCDGMTEELINRLSNLRNLKVTARTSAFAFKGKAGDIREIGEKLGVQNILEGSIQREGNRLRITVQLINASDSYHIWSETFDREFTRIFSIQDEIALAVADKLRFTLLDEEKTRLAKQPTGNQEAYQAYLQGRYFLERETPFLNKAREYLLRAVELDPQYGSAYAGLADYYTYRGEAGGDPREMIPRAREAALRALEIDRDLVDAHLAIGRIKLYYEWDWAGAEAEFLQAIRINANCARAYREYAIHLFIMKRYPEALEMARKGMELDPLSPLGANTTADVLKHMRRYEEAQKIFEKSLELNPNNDSVHWNLWLIAIETGREEDTQREMERLMEIGGFPGWSATPEEMKEFRLVCRQKGWKGGLKWNLDRMAKKAEKEYVSPYAIAHFHVLLGNRNEGIQWLKIAYEQRDMLMPYLYSENLFNSIRDDPRFQEIIKKMGFEK